MERVPPSQVLGCVATSAPAVPPKSQRLLALRHLKALALLRGGPRAPLSDNVR